MPYFLFYCTYFQRSVNFFVISSSPLLFLSGSCTLFFLNTHLVFCVNQLKLDEKEINTSDFWKRQIIIASMHKQPASFGIYVPAKDEAVAEGANMRRVCN